jgi:hypothetical protein
MLGAVSVAVVKPAAAQTGGYKDTTPWPGVVVRAYEGATIQALQEMWQARTAPTETDCVAGHVRLELRNVGANYAFERSGRFPAIKANSGHRDYSLLSCGGGETQLALLDFSQGSVHRGASPKHKVCRSRGDPAAAR